ncbi:unnamed protein product [Periconia digitata]|uniref:Leucine-rich repeat domain-containing protein n=1 Tax=Periconia digitata TaxID=1303443 RepID=A0A9W4UCC3_9PLEO|nr:unnamed protein product [Periconia digitata]
MQSVSLRPALPNEIILLIMESLLVVRGLLLHPSDELARRNRNKYCVKALHALALTCRRFNQMVTPLLYESFIHPRDDWGALAKFAQTLLDNPSLRDHVQYVECHVRPRRGGVPTRVWSMHMPYFPQKLFLEVVKAIGRSELEDEVSKPMRDIRKHAAIFTAVILLTRNVTHVQMDSGVNFITDYAWSHPSLKNLTMQRLYDVRASRAATPITSQTLVPAPGMSDAVWPDYGNYIIEEMAVHYCDMAPEILNSSIFRGLEIGSIVRLKRFACRWHKVPNCQMDYEGNINLQSLSDSLSAFQTTLETLILDTTESEWLVSLDEVIPTIGSLRRFIVLKHIDVSGLALWSDDPGTENAPLAAILPASLQTLVVHVEWDDEIEGYLMEFSRDCGANFPRLRNITIECTGGSAPTQDNDLLTGLFAMEKVQLVLRNDPRS